MSDGFDGGDFLLGMLLAGAVSGPRPQGHSHGEHWHVHVCPRGYHVHDGWPDGPIRLVQPPTPPPPEPVDPVVARNWSRAGGIAAAALALWVGGAGHAGGLVLLLVVAVVCGLASLVYDGRIESSDLPQPPDEPSVTTEPVTPRVPGEASDVDIVWVYRERPDRPALPPGEPQP